MKKMIKVTHSRHGEAFINASTVQVIHPRGTFDGKEDAETVLMVKDGGFGIKETAKELLKRLEESNVRMITATFTKDEKKHEVYIAAENISRLSLDKDKKTVIELSGGEEMWVDESKERIAEMIDNE